MDRLLLKKLLVASDETKAGVALKKVRKSEIAIENMAKEEIPFDTAFQGTTFT
jgi:hypothetical protein